MLTEILPGPLAMPVIFIMKFLLFIAFPMGTLAKEIRGLTDLSGAKVVQLKDDLKREFERHYTQRDEHFNRLISERMSDLRQTVMLLNKERLETTMKMEYFENKFEQLSTKLEEATATQCISTNADQSKMGCDMTEQQGNNDHLQSKTQNQPELVRNYVLLMAKVPAFEAKTEALQRKVTELDGKIETMAKRKSISVAATAATDNKVTIAAMEARLEALDGKMQTMAKRGFPATTEEDNKINIALGKLQDKVNSMNPLEEQPVIKLLLEQVIQTESTVQNHTQDLQQISAQIKHLEEEQEEKEESDNATGEASCQDLKQGVSVLTQEIKHINHAIGKLQTVTHEQYRTLMPTVQKVNENTDHLTELAAIIDDITSYHLKLVNSVEPTTSAEPVQGLTDAIVSSVPSTSSDNTGESTSSKFRCW